jgi:UDP-2,3-diacylglucosamine hydrolase
VLTNRKHAGPPQLFPSPQGGERRAAALSGGALFISDLHLTARRPETTDLLIDFLAGSARAAGALYILGDLFDYWLGDDRLDEPFNRRVCDALAAATGAGVASHFMPGNRDFLAGPTFAAATGLRMLGEPAVVEIGGVATLLLHGDTLCTDDADYQAFRSTVRSDTWRREFLAKPIAERQRDVETLRARSESEKQTKSYGRMDTNADAVAEAFRKHGVTRMIHGHTHRQASHELIVDGRRCQRWVLGDWGTTGNCLRCDKDAWRFETIGA